MKNSDVELIHRILDGDESAFSELVKKYQKPVHALVWRKIGDFHIAEEITQDTFLKAYQRLGTLKKPQSFTGWLYVIAANNCKMWLRKKRLQMQPLEETDSAQLEKATYSQYVIEENERTTVESQREVVKQLLAKLQESDRTVVTLHYFGEMSAAEIGKFLGVSVNTIKSRLRRAQQRLKREEPMIREALGNFQITPHLTENIMREISRLKPIAPSGGKPIVPWAVSAATTLFIFLIMGVSSQYLARFQRPYNIDAQSETAIEIIDVPIVLNIQAKPALRSQAGRFETPGKRSSSGSQLSKPVAPGAARVEKETRPSTQQQWTQASGFTEGTVLNFLLSAEGDIYAPSPVGVYRLASSSASAWTLINTAVTATDRAPMAEQGDTLYLASNSEVLASMDRGETWQSLGARPEGNAIGLVITDEGLYLALDNQVFRSTDAGQQWIPLNEKIETGIVLAIAAVKNTVFVGTTQGLYRADAETWEKLPMDTTKAVHSLAVSENNLYVGTGPDLFQPEGRASYLGQAMLDAANSGLWEVFHSTDFGNSWTEITPTSQSLFMKISPGVKVLASGETLLVLGLMGTFRSSDRGKTWTEFVSFDADTIDPKSVAGLMTLSIFPAMAANENTFFKVGPFGVNRSTDGGKSWNLFTEGIVDTRIVNLMAFKNGLYINTGTAIAKSTDGGDSWNALRIDTDERTRKPSAAEQRAVRQHGDRQQHQSELTREPPEAARPTDFLIFFAKLTIYDDVLYGIVPKVEKEIEPHIFYLSADSSTLVPIQRVPPFPSDLAIKKLRAVSQEAVPENRVEGISGDAERTDDFIDIAQQMDPSQHIDKYPSAFAVSGETFYVEYQRRLLRWKRGELEWFNTGLIDLAGLSDDIGSLGDYTQNLKLTVSGETVYAGKRDGHLFRSHDGGNTWKDLTSNLPLRFRHINEIVFVGSTLYVATDTGVLTSEDGEHWRVITDKTGTHTVIDRMAMTSTTVYGVGDSGAHLLDKRGEWEKISPEVPGNIISATINGNRLYVATEQRGMFHVSLENENN